MVLMASSNWSRNAHGWKNLIRMNTLKTFTLQELFPQRKACLSTNGRFTPTDGLQSRQILQAPWPSMSNPWPHCHDRSCFELSGRTTAPLWRSWWLRPGVAVWPFGATGIISKWPCRKEKTDAFFRLVEYYKFTQIKRELRNSKPSPTYHKSKRDGMHIISYNTICQKMWVVFIFSLPSCNILNSIWCQGATTNEDQDDALKRPPAI